jgi:hypothetical protein
MWSDKTFIFTAYTGLAASLFGGVTISKAAFLDRNEWQDVRIFVIDEVSFMSDTILKTLDRKLKEIENQSQPFGGFTIIFAGDFRQLEPIGAKDTELLFSSLSSQHWENCINAVIILNNEHRFKEDPEYGQMLKRMWSGDLTKEDRMRINTRVLVTNGLELPPEFEGKQIYKIFQIGINRFSFIQCKHLSLLSKEAHVMHVQQTKNEIPSNQQFFKNIYKQHTQM